MTSPGGGNDQTATVTLTANTTGYQQGMQQSTKDTNMLSKAVDGLAAKLDGITKRAGKKLIQFSAADFASLAAATATAATFEKQLATLRATASVLNKDLNTFKGGVESAFKEFPVARADVIQLTEAITNMGYTGVAQVKQLTDVFIKLGAASGENTVELANGLTQLSRLMGQTNPANIQNMANALLTVSKNAGVSSTAVLNFSQAIAPMARQAGIGEAAVLGISTAFSKAGADGYVAANTFNSMVSDITNLVQTGSPEIAKYASLIGVTNSQFKKMDKTNALVDIFESLAKEGPRAIQTLNRLGYDGVRAQAAISAVAQSGGLRESISQAVGNSNNSSNLNKASSTAFEGLSEQLIKLRNNFTQLGTEIGTTFLKPLEMALKPLNAIFQTMTELIKPFSGMIGAVGALAAGFTALGGAALLTLGIVSKLVLGSTLVKGIRNVGGSFAGGMAVGRDPTAINRHEQAFREGNMGFISRRAYGLGTGAGGWLGPGPAVPGANPVSAAVRGAAASALYATRFGIEDQRQMYQNSTNWAHTAGAGGPNPAAPMGFWRGMGQSFRMGNMGDEARQAALAAGKFTATSLGTATSMTGYVAGRAARTVGNVASGIGPLGAAMIGIPLAMMLKNSVDSTDSKFNKISDFNSISKYDQLLGTTASNLSKFSDAVKTATSSIGSKPITTIQQATTITAADRAKATGNYKPVDTNLNNMRGASNAQALAYLRSESSQTGGSFEPKRLNQIKLDLIKTYGADRAQKILNAYQSSIGDTTVGSGIDYTSLGSLSRGLNGGASDDYLGQGFKNINAAAGLVSGPQSNRTALKQIIQFSGGALNGLDFGNTDRTKQIRSNLAAFVGESDVNKIYGFPTSSDQYGTYNDDLFKKKFGSLTGSEGSVINSLLTSDKGKAYFKAAGVKMPTDKKFYDKDFAGVLNQAGVDFVMNQLGGGYPSPAKNEAKTLAGAGGLSTFALNNRDIASVIGNNGNIANPVQQVKAQDALVAQAIKMTGSLNGAGQALQKLADTAANGVDPALNALANSASAAVRARMQAELLPTMSRSEQTKYSVNNLRAAKNEMDLYGTDESKQNYQDALGYYEQMKQSNLDYAKSMYTTVRDYNTQMERSYEDYHRQVYRSQRDFAIQMEHSERDYNKQRFRMQRDFDKQMARQAVQSAQSIYNPYQRVYAQQTADAGTLLQNLQDQNQRIGNQYKELGQLKKMGITQQTIDVLDLSNPQNAQQLDTLVQSLMDNPNLVKSINQAVNKRQKTTTQLTQSDYNKTFRDTVDDFGQSFTDMAQDFETQRQDAVDAMNRGLNDMADDFGRMIDRSQEDLNTSLTEVTGSFQDMIDKTFEALGQSIGDKAPKYAKTIQDALNSIDFSNIGGGTGGYTGAGSDPNAGNYGTKGNPNLSPGTLGKTSTGQVGRYDESGKFHPVKTSLPTADLPYIGKPIQGGSLKGHLTSEDAQKYARSQLAKYGWSEAQMSSLETLWNNESGWRWDAENHSSGAYGIPQALPASKMSSAGSDWHDNAATQINWGLGYIKGRYGSPSSALNFWNNIAPTQNGSHWYDSGGVLEPGVTKTINATGNPEFILTPKQLKALHTVNKGNVASNVYKIYNDNSTVFKDIIVQAQDPNMMAKQLAMKAKVARLTRPPRSTAGR